MADEKANPSNPSDDKPKGPQGDNLNPSQDDKPENRIPQSRFNEEVAKRKELEEKIRAREEQDRKAQEEKLKEDKKYEELLQQRETELNSLKKEREELAKFRQQAEEKEKTRREALLNAIEDKELRSIAEKLPTSDDISAFAEKIKGKSDSRSDPKGAAAAKKDALAMKPGESAYDYGQRVFNTIHRGK